MIIETLRPAQEEVLVYREGTLAISAVPGAGKTFILTRLAARLVGELGVKPREILILTFMRSAAATFKRRIAKALTDRGLTAYGLQAMTIHAFCLSVIKRHDAYHADGMEDARTVLSEAEQVRLLIDGLERYLSNPPARAGWETRYGSGEGRQDPYQSTFDAAKRVISAAKSFRLSAEEVDLALGHTHPELAYLFRDYQYRLRESRSVDYDDQVQQAIALLKSTPDLLSWYQRRFRYVLEDEAQDSTPSQNELITLLSDRRHGGAGNLVRVGDSNQAITTTFTFNDPRFFREFCRQAARHVTMDESSRSAPEVLELANRLPELVADHPDPGVTQAFEAVQVRVASAGKANPTALRRPDWTVYPRKEDEQLGVLTRVRDFLRSNPDKKAAVLVFSNNQQREYLDKASEMGIALRSPTRRAGSKAVLEVLDRALYVLSLPKDPADAFLALLEARAKAERDAWMDLKAVRRHLKALPLERLVYPDGLPPHRPPALAESDYAAIVMTAAAMKQLLGIRHLPPTELLPTMAYLLLRDPEAPAIAAKAAAIARRQIDGPADPLSRLRLEIGKLMQASEKHELLASTADLDPHEAGQLEVLTLHKSKGAEYDAVWIPSLGYYYGTKTFFPWSLEEVEIWDQEAFLAQQAIVYHGQERKPTADELVQEAKRQLIAERLRLLYVGITRAERELHLSCVGPAERPAPAHIMRLAAMVESADG